MAEQFHLGDSVMVRPGEKYLDLNLDMSGWRGWVVDIDFEDGDLLIAWDAQTLREMPEDGVFYFIVDEIDWTCMYVEPEALLPFEPRSAPLDGLAVARERTTAHGLDFDVISNNPLFVDDMDDDDEFGFEPPLRPDYFDLDQFLYGLEIPTKEHPRVRKALAKGVGAYHYERYGRYPFGKQPADRIPLEMNVPFVFGFGVMEVLQRKQISRDTKIKVCLYALGSMEPSADDGLPFGMITILGRLAEWDALDFPLFRLGALGQEYGDIVTFGPSIWYFGTEREAVLALLDWLAAAAEIPDEEKLYWVWSWSLKCEYDAHLARAFARHWLALPNVPAVVKEALCWAWLRDADMVGTQPPEMKMMDALMAGDVSQVQALLDQLGLDADEALPDAAMPQIDPEEREMFSQMILMRRRGGLVPAPVKRLAIPTLARLGQDPLTVLEMFWDGDYDYYTDAIYGGMADLLREFQAQLPPDVLRSWVEKGLGQGRATVRKTFHVLARDLYGDAYLPQALDDSAKSLRTWAQKQMGKGK